MRENTVKFILSLCVKVTILLFQIKFLYEDKVLKMIKISI